jgi:putative phosphoribosyl transferase
VTAGADGRLVAVEAGGVALEGILAVPEGARGLVVFAHGSGSSRRSPRNLGVASQLRTSGLATLLFDLLTSDEDEIDRRTRELRFDIDLLARRVVGAVEWAASEPATAALRVGCFGASTGGAAALVAAAERPHLVHAVVSRGGRPDLAGPHLPRVQAPALLIVGGADDVVLDLNRQAMAAMRADVELEVVPGATHLFEEPGAIDRVAGLTAAFFNRHLSRG